MFFPFGEYPNVSHLVVSPQTNNRAEVSVIRAVLQTVDRAKDVCMYSDSQWHVDILHNIKMYKRQRWHTKSKQPIRHHDIWEDIYTML